MQQEIKNLSIWLEILMRLQNLIIRIIIHIQFMKNPSDYFLQIEAIRGRKKGQAGFQYLIKWKDWAEPFNTWQSLQNLVPAKDLVNQYEAKHYPHQSAILEQSWSQFESSHQKTENKLKNRISLNNNLQIRKYLTQLFQKIRHAKVGRPTMEQQRIRQIFKHLDQQYSRELLKRKLQQKHQDKYQVEKHKSINRLHKTNNDQSRSNAKYKRKLIANNKISRKSGKDRNDPSKEVEMIKPIEVNSQYGQLGEKLQQLLNSDNYQTITLHCKNKAIYFKIPLEQNNGEKMIQLQSDQIVKLNSNWIIKFYEGFYL